MGVQDVGDYLERNKGWHATKDIAAALKITYTSVNRSLKILRLRREVIRKAGGTHPFDHQLILWKAKVVKGSYI